jgi:hypothetical protein
MLCYELIQQLLAGVSHTEFKKNVKQFMQYREKLTYGLMWTKIWTV